MKMKSLFAVLFAAGVIFAAAGAEIKPGTPSHVVKTFFVSMADADFATAKKIIVDKEFVAMIKMFEDTIKADPEFKNEYIKELADLKNIEIISEKISGENATVVIKYPEDGKMEKATIKLKKIDGVWKITECE